ncbi:type II toxin-antitoxin system VapC family toxin [Devosia sp. A16]|uniref:type II toxin-antitoxin system VapC family toxin n=1 Tax=Devosia sp. A16 TaxID=1736675 RepID=UPI0006D80B65|nr:type II toxin-antitoxin system VapC family toxin [Devosia sp. A16]
MRTLLDTHLLLWVSYLPERLPDGVRRIILDPEQELHFSVASLWEIAIKRSQNRNDFDFDPSVLREGLLEAGYIELPVLGEHALAVLALPLIHKDPFDRMLVAQAIVAGVDLLTVDKQLAGYPGPIRLF